MPLAGRESGNPGETFEAPNQVDLDSVSYPDFEAIGLDGSVVSYRGNQSEEFVNDRAYPDYVGDYKLGFMDAPGLPTVYQGLNPAAGSADLEAPRDIGSVPGTDSIIQSDGPVTGRNSNWTGERGELQSQNPNYFGPNVGGADYAQQLAVTHFFAQQAEMFSQQAAASALVAAI